MANGFDAAAVINATDKKRHIFGFEQLNETETVVTLVSSARFEIELGGLSGFYYNSAGNYAVESVWAFEQLGALEIARVLQKSNAQFSQESTSRDRSCRYSELQRLASLATNPFKALTEEFYRVSDRENLDDLLDTYIEAHQSELPDGDA